MSLDLWSRRVTGWSAGRTLATATVLAALAWPSNTGSPRAACSTTATKACHTPAPNTGPSWRPPAWNRA